MLARTTQARRSALESARRIADPTSREIDFSVRFVTVDETPNQQYTVGGRFDRITRTFTGAPAENPVVLEVGKGQLPVIVENKTMVVPGAMGAGKTESLARAIIHDVIHYGTNDTYGVVAPTSRRLEIIWTKVLRLCPPSWVTDVKLHAGEIHFVNGCRLQFVSAKVYSSEIGSAIQGQDWSRAFVEELQDCLPALPDVWSRGRSAKDGKYVIKCGATQKDSPEWREAMAKFKANPDIEIYRMTAFANPFVDKEYWEQMKKVLPPRLYRMRVMALEARPEHAVYPDFDRELHLRPRPRVGAINVTPRICNGAPVLIGYDPGRIQHTSVLFQAYKIQGQAEPVWWCIDELITMGPSSEEHAQRLLELLREKWRVQLDPGDSSVVIRADPYGDSEERPDVTVYRQFARLDMRIMPAAYNKQNTGPGRLSKEARISTVNRLLKNAAGETRLFIDSTDGNCAPKLVASLEMSERDAAGKAEMAKKNKYDITHPTAAAGYALHPYEKTSMDETRATQAITDRKSAWHF